MCRLFLVEMCGRDPWLAPIGHTHFIVWLVLLKFVVYTLGSCLLDSMCGCNSGVIYIVMYGIHIVYAIGSGCLRGGWEGGEAIILVGNPIIIKAEARHCRPTGV